MKYKVEICEVLKRVEIIEADSPEEAQDIASVRWELGECELDGKDFSHAEFHAVPAR